MLHSNSWIPHREGCRCWVRMLVTMEDPSRNRSRLSKVSFVSVESLACISSNVGALIVMEDAETGQGKAASPSWVQVLIR